MITLDSCLTPWQSVADMTQQPKPQPARKTFCSRKSRMFFMRMTFAQEQRYNALKLRDAKSVSRLADLLRPHLDRALARLEKEAA